jgi:hypothetical protein
MFSKTLLQNGVKMFSEVVKFPIMMYRESLDKAFYSRTVRDFSSAGPVAGALYGVPLQGRLGETCLKN